jgi:low affinity Fe/Cu permease
LSFLLGILLAIGVGVQSRMIKQSASSVKQQALFPRFARVSARLSGHPFAFGIAFVMILLWAVSGPIFKFSDTWQLMINTATTIVTFLMVFLVQNAQSQDNEAIQLKLAELIRATEAAHNSFLQTQEIPQLEMARIQNHFSHLAENSSPDFRVRKSDLERPLYQAVSHHKHHPVLAGLNHK